MTKPSVLFVVLGLALSTTAAFGRGGVGSSHMSMSGGAFGTSTAASHMPVTGGAFGSSAATPGTNSLGTALPSSGLEGHPMKGPLLGTGPAIDREEAKVDKMMGSICRGC
jgi:hypothetical protein